VNAPSLSLDHLETPVGPLELGIDAEGALVRVTFLDELPPTVADPHPCSAPRRQLEEYFRGARRAFELPLSFAGTTFQRRVWHALLQIPYGETRTYGEVAKAIGMPSSTRAVGQANHVNPIAIVIPCHRVIGADGRLVGYGGGMDKKRILLAHERERGADWLF
jgi:methylated-DNA-[protein]-cysteine S-methyltransferase